jgi:hypothetical protein
LATSAVRQEAYGKECTLIFWGDGTRPVNTLSIGNSSVYIETGNPGWNVTVYGSLSSDCATSFNATLVTNLSSITIYADIACTSGGPAIRNNGSGTVNIEGGTITATGSGHAVVNAASGTVNISDAVLISVTGNAANNVAGGKMNISDTAIQTTGTGASSVYNNGAGTIDLTGITINSVGSAVNNRAGGTVNITGCTLFSETSQTVYNYWEGTIKITDGTISNGGAQSIFMNNAKGSLILEGSPEIGKAIRAYAGAAASQLKLGDSFAPVGTYVLEPADPAAELITVTGGAGIFSSFELTGMSKFRLDTSGNDIILVDSEYDFRLIKGTGANFTAQRNVDGNGAWVNIPGAVNVTIQTALDSVKRDAAGGKSALTFWGDASEPEANTLDIGAAVMTFDGSGFGWNVTLYGTLTAAVTSSGNAAIVLTFNASITSYADITNTSGGSGIRNTSTGTADIKGGTITNTSIGVAVANAGTGTVSISGDAVAHAEAHNAISNSSGGTVNVHGGTLSTSSVSVLGTISNNSTGKVNISAGTISNPNGWAV